MWKKNNHRNVSLSLANIHRSPGTHSVLSMEFSEFLSGLVLVTDLMMEHFIIYTD